jgi:hypothetical protein
VRMRFLADEWFPAADTNAALLSITAQHPDATVVDARLSAETLRALAEAEESRIAPSHCVLTHSGYGFALWRRAWRRRGGGGPTLGRSPAVHAGATMSTPTAAAASSSRVSYAQRAPRSSPRERAVARWTASSVRSSGGRRAAALVRTSS